MAPIDPLVFRSLSCPEIEYSIVSTRESCTSERSLPTRAPVSRSLSPAIPSRIQVTIKHRRQDSATNSESCGSSAAAPAGSTNSNCRSTVMDNESRVFLHLHTLKYLANFSTEWRASSDEVLKDLFDSMNDKHSKQKMTIDEIKEIVTGLEEKVSRHKLYGEELRNKDTLLLVFNYVEPQEYVPDSQEGVLAGTQLISSPSSSKRVKRISSVSSSSLSYNSGGSVQPELYDVCHGPYNMVNCTAKLERLGYDGDMLLDAIDIFTDDLPRCQVFLKLGDPDAFKYASRQLKKLKKSR